MTYLNETDVMDNVNETYNKMYYETVEFIKKRMGDPHNKNDVYDSWIEDMADGYMDYFYDKYPEDAHSMEVYFDDQIDVPLAQLFEIERYEQLDYRYSKTLSGKIENIKKKIKKWTSILDYANKKCGNPHERYIKNTEAMKKLSFYLSKCIKLMDDYFREKRKK